MTERPILFSAPMVRALLAGRKMQTRRVVKHPHASEVDAWAPRERVPGMWRMGVYGEGGVLADMGGIRCPYGAPGNTLWVRETWAPCEASKLMGRVQFAADGAVGREATSNGGERWWVHSGFTVGISDAEREGVWVSKPSKWRSPRYMPRWASRITLRMTSVRVERLSDISEADAMAEGVVRCSDGGWHAVDTDTSTGRECFDSPGGAFRSLWEDINGAGSWAANPWVWVLGFEVVR